MTPATIENVRARYESGYSVQRIANQLRMKRSDVLRAINHLRPQKSQTANAARKRLDQMREAVAELLAAGCDAKVIEANFGSV